MKVRRLQPKEHQETRLLWEKVFREDTEKFLDYYYTEKTGDNEIYVVEEGGQICSMLHLNPYKMSINGSCDWTNYIVAVATDENFRKRGYMGTLLRHSLQVMYERKEPFTFLMPAAEAIYRPYDFRFIYEQYSQKICAGEKVDEELTFRSLSEEDIQRVVSFANEILEENQVYTLRDSAYYRRLQKECRSENGEVVIAERHSQLVGVFAYGKETEYQILEPLFRHQEDLPQAVRFLLGKEGDISCHGCKDGTARPLIMARIIHLEAFLSKLELREDVRISFCVTDPILKENNGAFCIWGNKNGKVLQVERIEESEELPKLSVAQLCSLAFGMDEREEVPKELKELWKPVKPMKKVFLNEVV